MYAYQLDDDRHAVAQPLLAELWNSGTGVISTQVLQEFYVTVTRKLPQPLPRSAARQVLSQYREWPVQVIDPTLILAASNLEERHRLSFWDALIVAAAQRVGAARLLSEDLQAGRSLEGLTIENPFA